MSSDPAFNEIVGGLKGKGINCARFSDMESLFKHIAEPFSATNEVSQADKVVDIKEPRKR